MSKGSYGPIGERVRYPAACCGEFSSALLTDVFTQAKYEVTSVRDPLEAVKIFQETDFHLVVTDQCMPNLSGKEFVKTVKEIRSKTPVVIVSGYLDDETISECINNGVDGVFLKPLNVFSLLKKTGELIERAAMDRECEGESGSVTLVDKHNLPFQFHSFPCLSEVSAEFARRLHEVRNFKSNLLLVGEGGTDFEGVCRDLCDFGKQTGDRDNDLLVVLTPDRLSGETLLEDFAKWKVGTSSIVTFVVLDTENLQEDETTKIIAIARGEKPFHEYRFQARFVFCIGEHVETLYDKKILGESFYIFLGTTEIAVPPLYACSEDIPIIAQRIINSETRRLDSGTPLTLSADAITYLKRKRWKRNHSELKGNIVAALKHSSTNVIMESDLLYATESRYAPLIDTSNQTLTG